MRVVDLIQHPAEVARLIVRQMQYSGGARRDYFTARLMFPQLLILVSTAWHMAVLYLLWRGMRALERRAE